MSSGLLLIPGTIDSEQWKRCGMPSLKESQYDEEEAERAFQALLPHFGKVFEEPWEATRSLMDYLKIPVCTPFFSESDGQTSFGVNFSGCAGNAEVSAHSAAHFLDIWIRRNPKLVRELLYKHSGFLLPDPYVSEVVEPGPFFPTRFGYGLLVPASEVTETYEDEEDLWQVPRLRIDNSVIEAYEEDKLSLISSVLNEELKIVPDNSPCMCQLCSPDLDLRFLEKLPPWH